MDPRSIKVLYVEDDTPTRESFTKLLKHYFDNILVGKDGEEGFKLFLDNTDVDVIMTDIRMPKIDGLELLKKAKEVEPDIHCIVITAYNETKDILKAIEVGINHYVPKPLEANKLGEVLEKVISSIEIKRREKAYKESLQIINKQLIEKDNQLERALNLQKTFIASMSHEFRTPLNSIIGFIDLLKTTTTLDKKQQEYTHNAMESSNHLLSLVNNILDVTKIETGQLKIYNEEINIEETLFEAYEATKKHLHKGVDFKVDIPDVPYTVIGDNPRIKQILINLLNNSMRFTKEGFVKFSLSHIDTTKTKGKIEIKIIVEDSGTGISPTILEKLFKPFAKAHEKAIEGTGLGLYISQSISKLMNGNIILESQENKGTKATFSLNLDIGKGKDYTSKFEGKTILSFEKDFDNLEDRFIGYGADFEKIETIKELEKEGKENFLFFNVDNSVNSAKASDLKDLNPKLTLIGMNYKKENQRPFFVDQMINYPFTLFKIASVLTIKENNLTICDKKFKNLKVLLVDDISLNIVLGKEILKNRFAIIPDTAKNGYDAIEKAKANNYDVIFMDIKMPMINGLEATKEILKTNSSSMIVAMTANAYSEDKDEAINAGMKDYITKPISVEEINRIFERKNNESIN
ncbi:MAG: response regulator [Campylobacterales bacterium]|nr:response regulator [Campylobacterales bacterium]